jgi:hypothetical protein
MPKALCSVGGVIAQAGPKLMVPYTVAINVPVLNFGSQYQADTSVSLAQNLTNMKAKVVADCAGQGVTLTAADVIVFGGPV